MAQLGPPAFIGFDSLVQKRNEGRMKIIRSLAQAYDIAVVGLHSFSNLLFESFGSHSAQYKSLGEKRKGKMSKGS